MDAPIYSWLSLLDISPRLSGDIREVSEGSRTDHRVPRDEKIDLLRTHCFRWKTWLASSFFICFPIAASRSKAAIIRKPWVTSMLLVFALTALIESVHAESSIAGLLLAFNVKGGTQFDRTHPPTDVLMSYRPDEVGEYGFFLAYIVPKKIGDYFITIDVQSAEKRQSVVRCLSSPASVTNLPSSIQVVCPWGGFLPKGGLVFKVSVNLVNQKEVIGEIYLPDIENRGNAQQTNAENQVFVVAYSVIRPNAWWDL